MHKIFTHALFYLAQNQNLSLVDFLREEIDACVRKHGWTKAATEEMFNLESVMGEVMRLAPLNGGEYQLSFVLDEIELYHSLMFLLFCSAHR